MLCYGCMRELEQAAEICPYCGYRADSDTNPAECLKPGYILAGRYILGRLLSHDYTQTCYIAEDTKRNQTVEIREFFYRKKMQRSSSGSSLFCADIKSHDFIRTSIENQLDEARIYMALVNCANTLNICDCFEANNTAYIVYEHLHGRTFAEYLAGKGGRLRPEKAVWLMLPVLNALEKMHKNGVVHCNVSPDSIMLCDDGSIKLTDFDSSCFANDNCSRATIIKPGYSANELYLESSNYGPWSDVYSVCAILYRAITGEAPPEAAKILLDSSALKKFSDFGFVGYNRLEQIVFSGLKIEPEKRIKSVSQLRELLEAYSCEKNDSDAVGRRMISSTMLERKDIYSDKKYKARTAVLCVIIVLLATALTAVLVTDRNSKNKVEASAESSTVLTNEAPPNTK